MEKNNTTTPEKLLYSQRSQRIADAIALKEPDKIPLAPFFSCVIQNLYGSNYRNIYYDHEKAIDAVLSFYTEYPQCDAGYAPLFASGKALELSGFNFIDWPGRPGTKVSDYSSQQVLEREVMMQDEYPELLGDFTGFLIRKYIPRMFDNIKGFEKLDFKPFAVLNTSLLTPFWNPEIEETYKLLIEIGKHSDEATASMIRANQKLAAIGMPSMFVGATHAPYDILGDYFRGTIGIMEDLIDHEDEILEACEMFADQQIQALRYVKDFPIPDKRVFFPLHKGMDGFMSPRQYEKLYWNPLKRVMMSLIDVGVTPYIYTEGKYNSRMETLTDVPKGKVLYHFEDVDMKEAKKLFTGVACIMGNLPIAMVEFSKKEKIIDYCKYLVDTCAPGGGYIFDFNGSLENAPRENIDAIFETFETYK